MPAVEKKFLLLYEEGFMDLRFYHFYRRAQLRYIVIQSLALCSFFIFLSCLLFNPFFTREERQPIIKFYQSIPDSEEQFSKEKIVLFQQAMEETKKCELPILRLHWKVCNEAIKVFSMSSNINYLLYGNGLLGHYRHNGFIP